MALLPVHEFEVDGIVKLYENLFQKFPFGI